MLLFTHMLTKHNSCRKHFFAVETLKTRQIWVVRCVYEVLRGQRFVYSRGTYLASLDSNISRNSLTWTRLSGNPMLKLCSENMCLNNAALLVK